jgi:hypothetical protein
LSSSSSVADRAALVPSASIGIPADHNYEVMVSQIKALVDAGDHEGVASTMKASCMVLAASGDFARAASLRVYGSQRTICLESCLALSDGVDSDSLLVTRCKALADAGDYEAAAALKLKASSTRTNRAAAADESLVAACTAAAQRDALLVARCKVLADAGNYEGAAALKLQAMRTQSTQAAYSFQREHYVYDNRSASVPLSRVPFADGLASTPDTIPSSETKSS